MVSPMTTDQLIDKIAAAASAGDWASVQYNFRALKQLMAEEGRPLAGAGAYRLVEAMSNSTAQGQPGGPNPYLLIQQINEAARGQPIDRAALQASWDSLYVLLANPTAQIEANAVAEVLRSLRAARLFDLLSRAADRALARAPDDAVLRCLYGQGLIDGGQPHAGIEMLQTVVKLPNARESDLYEAHGILGRGYKQLYVDAVTSAALPPSARAQLGHYLNDAIREYSLNYDPARPSVNHWHGINLAALLVLARNDGHRDVVNPTGKTPEELARGIIDALKPQAGSTNDGWVLASLGEACLVLGDYTTAAQYYGQFVAHPSTKADPSMLASAVRQLEQVWRLEPADGGGGPILAVLKSAQIALPEGKFTLPGDSLKQIATFAGTKEAADFRETMVPGGSFVKLAELQMVVMRAAAVAAVADENGRTMGTGFLLAGSDLHESLGRDIYMLTNAHVMSDPTKPGAEPKTLDPRKVRIILEGADRANLTCDPEVVWQSPVVEHDACLVRINCPIGSVKPLTVAPEGTRLSLENEAAHSGGSTVSVIGYPLGGPLSLSTVGTVLGANGALVDMGARKANEDDPVYLHYRAPTEPGNSGSPVFETDKWTVIGLHHMGFNAFDGRPRLRGQPGIRQANEGIEIRSIKRALASKLKGNGGARGMFGRRK